MRPRSEKQVWFMAAYGVQAWKMINESAVRGVVEDAKMT